MLFQKLVNYVKRIFHINNSTYYINGSENLLPPLNKDEEEIALNEYKLGSIEARNKLIEHNLRLVVYVAKRYESNLYNLEDLISIGTLGLIKAISTFKADKNIKLATYASRCIDNEILMFLRKKTRMRQEVSIDEPLNRDKEGNELLIADILSTEENEVVASMYDEETKNSLREEIAKLRPRERQILSLRFGLDGQEELTQKEVAEFLGISQSYISRLEKKILKKLKVGLKY